MYFDLLLYHCASQNCIILVSLEIVFILVFMCTVIIYCGRGNSFLCISFVGLKR